MNYSFQWSLLFFALASQIAAFSGTTTERMRPFVISGRRTIHQSQQSRSAASTELFMSDASNKINKSNKQDDQHQSRFLQGDDLHQRRLQVLDLQRELHQARNSHPFNAIAVEKLEHAILSAQQVDAEFIYTVARDRMQAAAAARRLDEVDKYCRQAVEARNALPQFNLEGLWVGKYGEQGFEMINVTYQGDTLTAFKVTGDRNVPQGQASFTVDLSLDAPAMSSSSPSRKEGILEPIEIAADAAEQWGGKFLQRFSGKGQVASKGFVNSQWIDGQLILVGEHFSFAWLPIGHQVFFGRPSPELTLKLLSQQGQGQGQFGDSDTGDNIDDKQGASGHDSVRGRSGIALRRSGSQQRTLSSLLKAVKSERH
jgi:hypothetical protein